jgi:tellurite resistance protein TerC
MPDDTKEVIRRQVARVQQRYDGLGVVLRVLWLLVACTVVIAGLAMTVFPGPAIVVLPLGMAMLAAQFAWASRLLNVGIERGVDAKRRVQAAPAVARFLMTLAGLSLTAAVVAYLLLR